jgi:hypothetical protein
VEDPAGHSVGHPEPGADLGEGPALDAQLDGQALPLAAGTERTPGEPFGGLLVAMVVISSSCSGTMIGRRGDGPRQRPPGLGRGWVE